VFRCRMRRGARPCGADPQVMPPYTPACSDDD
jgi:hypothetical protein